MRSWDAAEGGKPHPCSVDLVDFVAFVFQARDTIAVTDMAVLSTVPQGARTGKFMGRLVRLLEAVTVEHMIGMAFFVSRLANAISWQSGLGLMVVIGVAVVGFMGIISVIVVFVLERIANDDQGGGRPQEFDQIIVPVVRLGSAAQGGYSDGCCENGCNKFTGHLNVSFKTGSVMLVCHLSCLF